MSFMPGGITWMCKRDQMGETWTKQQIRLWLCLIEDPTSTFQWLTLPQSFSARRLTFKIHRLQAIQDILWAMEKARSGGYSFGVCGSDLEKHLIWWESAPKSGPRGDLPDLPSWSWAAIGGSRKCFLPIALFFHKKSVKNTRALGHTSLEPGSRAISVRGFLYEATLPKMHPNQLSHCCLRIFDNFWAHNSIEKRMFDLRSHGVPHSNFLVAANKGPYGPEEVQGIAVFDRGSFQHSSSCR